MMNEAFSLLGLNITPTDQDVENYINCFDLTDSG